MTFSFPLLMAEHINILVKRYAVLWSALLLTIMSIFAFFFYYHNGLGLAYNDARSHLDIGRRVVEGLKPGIAQLGSVWLPLPHLLMVPTVWIDFMWHSGLSGALQSMISYVTTGILMYKIMQKLGIRLIGRMVGIALFATNLNILYLQSTAMTELLLIATMTAGVYELINFHKDGRLLSLLKASFWIMLSTLIRYDGWFLFFYAALLIILYAWRKKGYQMTEGIVILFSTLAGFGIFLWILWNAVIFKDPLYFAFGPYSAHAQQEQLDKAGVLPTKKNFRLSTITYWYAMVYNSGILVVLLGIFGALVLATDQRIHLNVRIATTALIAPLLFNIIALYLGHSVLFVPNINGETWFNIRYGIMMVPSFAIFIGYLVHRFFAYRWLIIGMLLFITFFAFANRDTVTIDDGTYGSSQKNVTEVSHWLYQHVKNEKGFVLISAASHDAVIFSSQLPMKRFIHEGTGSYWESATSTPDRWAHWIVMRTNDENDQTFKLVKKTNTLYKYTLVQHYPFADIYQLNDQYMPGLQTEPVLSRQR